MNLSVRQHPVQVDTCCFPLFCQPTRRVPSSFKNSPAPDGVSVHYLRHVFAKEVMAYSYHGLKATVHDLENLNFKHHGLIRRKGAELYCLLDGKKGATYIDCIDAMHKGPATVMLSYSWSYTMESIIESLEEFCRDKGCSTKDVYVWMCFLCCNQHRAYERRKKKTKRIHQEFFKVFQKTVTSVGHVLAIISPWNDPTYMTRTWCNFELFLAETSPECKITLTMPPNERTLIVNNILLQRTLPKALTEPIIENTSATEESDRVLILKWIRVNVGYEQFNRTVKALVRKWILDNLETVVKECECDLCDDDVQKHSNYASLCSMIGSMMYSKEEYDVAFGYYQRSFRVHEKIKDEDHADTASARRSIGLTLKQKGDIDGALIELRKALVAFRKAFHEEDGIIADMHAEIGLLLLRKGELDDALVELKSTLRICKNVLGPDHHSTAVNNVIIGKILKQKGDLDNSLQHFQAALDILLKINKVHPEVAEVRTKIGNIFLQRNNERNALVSYRKALHIQLKVLGRYHPHTASTYNNIGEALSEMNDVDGALTKHQNALEIQFKVFGEFQNIDIAFTQVKIGKIFMQKGEFDQALVALKKAFDVYSELLGNDNSSTLDASKMIDQVSLLKENENEKEKVSLLKENNFQKETLSLTG